DFRIDFIAFCLFGVVQALVVYSRLLAERRWALLVGAAAALLVLFRFLTLLHILSVLVPFLLVTSWRAWRAPQDSAVRRERWRSVQGTVLALGVLVALSLPLLWHNRSMIWNYYMVSALTDVDRRAWAEVVGSTTLFQQLTYYPLSLASNHCGVGFLITA